MGRVNHLVKVKERFIRRNKMDKNIEQLSLSRVVDQSCLQWITIAFRKCKDFSVELELTWIRENLIVFIFNVCFVDAKWLNYRTLKVRLLLAWVVKLNVVEKQQLKYAIHVFCQIQLFNTFLLEIICVFTCRLSELLVIDISFIIVKLFHFLSISIAFSSH